MSESLPNWDVYLDIASLSDVGMRRSNNQDNLAISLGSTIDSWRKRGHLFIVADGMGAHAAGELASKLAVDQIPHLYAKYNDLPPPDALKKSVQSANAEINRRGQANEEFHNMGTTCCVLSILPQGGYVAHIGDSRVYRLRQNSLEQLTFDHSLVWEMRASGQITREEELSGRIPKNVITRSLGPYPECKVDMEGPFPIQVGDTYLLCSDGLTGLVTDEEIGAIIANLQPNEAAKVLVDLANLRGGPDNITVVIVKAIHPDIATSANAGGFSVESKGNASGVSSALAWTIMGASLLATILLIAVTQSWITGIIPGGAFLISLIYLLMKLAGNTGTPAGVSPLTRLGKAPYTRTDCAQGEKVAAQLAEVIKQLQDGAQEQKWPVDWAALEQMVGQAKEAGVAGDHAVAVRNYGRAISFLMDQLRDGEAGNSSIDL